jgi:hypothetical protein
MMPKRRGRACRPRCACVITTSTASPVMDALHAWFVAQFADKKVETHSGLGEAISYCLKRWYRLTSASSKRALRWTQISSSAP